MSRIYNILWIDDEHDHEDMLPFIMLAENNNIHIDGYSNYKAGFEALENNFNHYDAILLDALFFEDEQSETVNPKGLGASIARINELKARKSFPHFVLSGQASFTDVENAFLDANNLECYNKKNLEDLKRILDDIKNASDQQETTQLKHKYPNVFAICEEKYLDSKHFDRILQLVKDVESPSQIKVAQDMLNPMRKIIESLFSKLNELEVIPDEIKNSQGWITGSSRFLAGKDHAYEYKENIIPPMLAEGIYRLLNITQDGSHNEGTTLNADSYLATSKTPYLYLSCVYLLFDILDEMKDFIDANQEVTKNKEKYQLIEVTGGASNFEGEIMQDGQGNYHCDIYILSYNYVHGKFNVGQRIRITKEGENTNPKTNQFYSRRAIRFETIK